MMLDELEFFLRCRFLLFKGPELETSQGKYNSVHFIELEKVIKLSENVLYKFSFKEINDVKNLFNSRSKRSGSIVVINSAYVLRVLLEYYRNEKRGKFFLIKKWFNEYPKKKNSESLSFSSFKDLCLKLDNNISYMMIMKLYREAYYLGNGIIKFDNFFIAVNELGIWSKKKLMIDSGASKKQDFKKLLQKSFYFLKFAKTAVVKTGISEIVEKYEFLAEILENFEKYTQEEKHD